MYELSLDKLLRRDAEALGSMYKIADFFECFETGAGSVILGARFGRNCELYYRNFDILLIWLANLMI